MVIYVCSGETSVGLGSYFSLVVCEFLWTQKVRARKDNVNRRLNAFAKPQTGLLAKL